MKPLAVAALAAIFPGLAAAEITVTDPWARATILANRPGAAYLTLESDTNDRLMAIETPAAGHVMIHRIETDDSGVSRMVHLETLDLPPGKLVTLAPGGMHLMLMGLAAKLEEGGTFPLTLRFEEAGEMTVEMPILGVAAAGPDGKQ
ncbi:copper chaperone PCu(A)C [Roseovarius sp. MBR-6]|jgi:copper(I)-binding protein|uniref:copper chaperone PCu(A)C n=1 Tax=Roseovarius sp. MBR-6 TaxID=3156459 RepID=UPI00339507B4